MKKQRGLSLVLVIFMLVVLGMLGAAMLRMMSVSSDSVAREVLSIRALHTAESGAQRKLSEIFTTGSAAANCIPSGSYSFPALAGCSATEVSCRYKTIGPVNYYTIESTGKCGPTGDWAVRKVKVQAKDI